MTNYPCEFQIETSELLGVPYLRWMTKLPFDPVYGFKNTHARGYYGRWIITGNPQELQKDKEKLQRIVNEQVEEYDKLKIKYV